MKNTLSFLIESHGLNNSSFAREIGVSRQTVIRILKGKPPSMEVGLKIANYFNKDVTDIFFTPDVKHIAQEKKKQPLKRKVS